MQTSEVEENVTNPFMFAGQYYDAEIKQYYMRARQYDPHIFRFSTRDPVQGCFKEPLSLHKYLYCQNDPINKTDPKGEMWGALRRAYRTVYGISSYYTILGVSLEAASSPWEVMDVAIASNAWRETYFDPENLNKPFAWEIAMRNLPSNILELTSLNCDWYDLGGCMLPVINKAASTYTFKKLTGYSAAGAGVCAACAIEPTKASCVLCVAFITIEAVSNAKTVSDTIGCLKTHCGN